MSKILVAYFSAGGVTAKVAASLAEAVSADLYELRPETPYTRADLNWMDKNSRTTLEMQDASSRPALKDRDADIAGHDTIFLGFPIWWYTAPHIVNSFLESYDFSGKRIILFATSGSSGFEHSLADLKKSLPADTEISEGEMLNGRRAADGIRKLAKRV